MANIFDVAKYMLDNIGEEISTMKLQKLCYYSQAWHMVWNDKQPLFSENFQAWANGPVCEPLFKKHKGCFAISSCDITDNLLNKDLTQNQIIAIDSVIEFYGNKTGAWLSELSHNELPWKSVREKNNLNPGDKCSEIITKESMYEYYSSLK